MFTPTLPWWSSRSHSATPTMLPWCLAPFSSTWLACSLGCYPRIRAADVIRWIWTDSATGIEKKRSWKRRFRRLKYVPTVFILCSTSKQGDNRLLSPCCNCYLYLIHQLVPPNLGFNPPLREPRSGNFFPNSWVRPGHCNIVEFGFHPL